MNVSDKLTVVVICFYSNQNDDWYL